MVFIVPTIPKKEHQFTKFDKWFVIPIFMIALFPEWLIKHNTSYIIKLESLEHPLDLD